MMTKPLKRPSGTASRVYIDTRLTIVLGIVAALFLACVAVAVLKYAT